MHGKSSDSYDGQQRILFPLSCAACGGIFQVPKHLVAKVKFCSKQCSSTARSLKSSTEVECAFCKKKFRKPQSKLKGSKSGLYFCSRVCKDSAQKIGGIPEIQPPHYNTGQTVYREIAFKSKAEICERCGFDTFPAILIVHHKDLDRSNNAIENLEVLCQNCHGIEHYLSKTGMYNRLK